MIIGHKLRQRIFSVSNKIQVLKFRSLSMVQAVRYQDIRSQVGLHRLNNIPVIQGVNTWSGRFSDLFGLVRDIWHKHCFARLTLGLAIEMRKRYENE